jgi:hypothetical protein
MDDDTESIARAVPEAALICRGSRVFVATQVLKESVSRLDWARSRQRRQCNPTRRKREKPVSRKLFHGPRLAYVASSYHAGEGATATLARRRCSRGRRRCGSQRPGAVGATWVAAGLGEGPSENCVDAGGRSCCCWIHWDGDGDKHQRPMGPAEMISHHHPLSRQRKGRAETTIEGREKGCITLQLSFCLHFVQRETGRVNGV